MIMTQQLPLLRFSLIHNTLPINLLLGHTGQLRAIHTMHVSVPHATKAQTIQFKKIYNVQAATHSTLIAHSDYEFQSALRA